MILHAQVWSWDALAMSARSGVPFWHPHPWVSRRVPLSMRARQRSRKKARAIAAVATKPIDHRAVRKEYASTAPGLALSSVLDRVHALRQGRSRRCDLGPPQWRRSASARARYCSFQGRINARQASPCVPRRIGPNNYATVRDTYHARGGRRAHLKTSLISANVENLRTSLVKVAVPAVQGLY